jgi:hypothetical protein
MRPTLRSYLHLLFLALFSLSLMGCETMGLVKPKTLDQKLAYAESQVTAGYQSVADLANRQRISKDAGTRTIKQLDEASTALKAARLAVGAGDMTLAQNQLNAAQTILVSVEAALKEANK